MPIFRQKLQKFATQSLPKHNKTGEIAVNFSRFSFSDMPKPLKGFHLPFPRNVRSLGRAARCSRGIASGVRPRADLFKSVFATKMAKKHPK